MSGPPQRSRSRHRLGVVLLFDAREAAEVQGLRRALGAPTLDTVPPHITLVPPVNVRTADLPAAMRVLRTACARHEPLELETGPVATFSPVTPVVYLAVSGRSAPNLSVLAAELSTGPLTRATDHPFVPHVTLHEDAAPGHVAVALEALGAYRQTVRMDRLWVLEQGADRVWRPLADVPLGPPSLRVHGGSAVGVRTTLMPAPDTVLLLGGAPGDLVHEATVDEVPVGALISTSRWGHRAVTGLQVDGGHRGTGIGRRLINEVAADARARGEVLLEWVGPEPDLVLAALLGNTGFTPVDGRWSRPV
jgi:2'-5' RNA ligase